MLYIVMGSSVIAVTRLRAARPTIRISIFRGGKTFSLLNSACIRSESLVTVSKVFEA